MNAFYFVKVNDGGEILEKEGPIYANTREEIKNFIGPILVDMINMDYSDKLDLYGQAIKKGQILTELLSALDLWILSETEFQIMFGK